MHIVSCLAAYRLRKSAARERLRHGQWGASGLLLDAAVKFPEPFAGHQPFVKSKLYPSMLVLRTTCTDDMEMRQRGAVSMLCLNIF
jgi:hypothetical protein